jgi:hypothetical protein
MNSGRERVERRLAAILAADVAGYSRLMSADLWMGGWTILTLGGDRATGLNAIEHVLALNPNSALA